MIFGLQKSLFALPSQQNSEGSRFVGDIRADAIELSSWLLFSNLLIGFFGLSLFASFALTLSWCMYSKQTEDSKEKGEQSSTSGISESTVGSTKFQAASIHLAGNTDSTPPTSPSMPSQPLSSQGLAQSDAKLTTMDDVPSSGCCCSACFCYPGLLCLPRMTKTNNASTALSPPNVEVDATRKVELSFDEISVPVTTRAASPGPCGYLNNSPITNLPLSLTFHHVDPIVEVLPIQVQPLPTDPFGLHEHLPVRVELVQTPNPSMSVGTEENLEMMPSSPPLNSELESLAVGGFVPTVSSFHRMSTISTSLSDVASAGAVLGCDVGVSDYAHRRLRNLPCGVSRNLGFGGRVGFSPCGVSSASSSDALKRSFTTNAAARARTKSLLESRRGSHTSLTLNLSPGSRHRAPGARSVNLHTLHGVHSNGFSGSPGRILPPPLISRGDDVAGEVVPPQTPLWSYGSGCQIATFSSLGEDVADSADDGSGGHVSEEELPCVLLPSSQTTDESMRLRLASRPLTGPCLIKKLLNDGASLFEEFWDIPVNSVRRDQCQLAGISFKNRYPEVLPNDETRVILPPVNNDETSSYINANYIHGYLGCPKAFIATQGPMAGTVNDFWRMIWHSRSPAIVMMTKIVERGKPKCELYLPNGPPGQSGGGALRSPGRADTVPESCGNHDSVPTTSADAFLVASSSCASPNGPLLQSAYSFPSGHPDAKSRARIAGAALGTPAADLDISRTCSLAGAHQQFGTIHVRVDAVFFKTGYTKRYITMTMFGEERKVTHFWYVAWPDHSSPEGNPAAARHLLKLVAETEACRYSKQVATDASYSFSLPSTPAPIGVSLLPSSLLPATERRRYRHQPRRQHAQEHSDTEVDAFCEQQLTNLACPETPLSDIISLPDATASIENSNGRFWTYHTPESVSPVSKEVPTATVTITVDTNVIDEFSPSALSNSLTFRDFEVPHGAYRASDPMQPYIPTQTGPLVVHCSAGVGRTGCFIALCIGVEQLRHEGKVDVLGIVNRLRLDRGGMIENNAQYAFLHIALATFYSLRARLPLPEFPLSDLSFGFPGPGR